MGNRKAEMHPSRRDLRGYCDRRLAGAQFETITAHLESCQFCREFCSEFRAMTEHIDEAVRQHRPGSGEHPADGIYHAALAGLSIRLVQTTSIAPPEVALLAADGSSSTSPRLENLGTLYSENPEIVLRIMRDNVHRCEYLQLVSEDDRLISSVLVQVPALDLSILTDRNGRGDIDWREIKDLARHEWRVKLPDAEFSLAPLEYDPDQVEYHEETVLETTRGDRVGIRFEGRVEDKRITVRILQLGGRSDFGTVHVAVTQAGEAVAARLSDQDVLHMDLTSPRDTIAIRLYRE